MHIRGVYNLDGLNSFVCLTTCKIWKYLKVENLGQTKKPIFEQKSSYTVCPGSSDLFHIVIYYTKWVTTSWTDGRN